jgi:hypothetical protein
MAKPLGPKSILIREAIKAHPNKGNSKIAEMLNDAEDKDGRQDHGKPRVWKYVQHSACHWLVNFNLRLAQLAEPDRPWRIVSSGEHSAVWDGQETFFDFNFLALGIDPGKCFRLANGRHLPAG